MKIKRTNLTIPEGLYAEAQRIMASQHFNSFSDYIAHLVRQDSQKPSLGDNIMRDSDEKFGGPPKKLRNASARTAFYSIPRKVAVAKPD